MTNSLRVPCKRIGLPILILIVAGLTPSIGRPAADGPFRYIRCTVDWEDYSGVWRGSWREWGSAQLETVYRIGPNSISEYEHSDIGPPSWKADRCDVSLETQQQQCTFSDGAFSVEGKWEDARGRIIAETNLWIDRRRGTFVEEDDWYPQDDERKGYGACEAIDDPRLDRKF